MPSDLFTNEETGEQGRFHMIRGERRFIPDDPLDAPGAAVNLQVPGFDTGIQIAGGATGAALIGFGETLSNTALRARAAFETITGKEGTSAQAEFAEVKSLLAPLEAQHPFATAVGQSVPGFLLPASKAVQTVGGAAEGLLADPENPFLGAALGAGGAFIGGAIGERLGRAILARGSGAAGRLAARKIPTTLAQRNPGNVSEQGIEAGLAALPVISRWASAPIRAQQRALNRGAASVFGYEGVLNRKGLGEIRAGISKSFDQVQRAIPDQQLDSVLIDRLDDAGVIDQATKDFMQGFGIVDGEAMMAIRSNLNNDMADAFINANRKEGRQLRALLNEVDDLITEQMPEELVQQWATARKQWQFMTAITRGKAITGAGDVNLATMRNNLDKIYPGFRFGKDLPGTAKGFGELVTALDELPKALQSSGTAERAMAASILTAGTVAIEPTTAVIPVLAAARAAGRPGVGAGSLIGRAAARQVDIETIAADDSDSDTQ